MAIRRGVHAMHVLEGPSDPRISGDVPGCVAASHTSGSGRVDDARERLDTATAAWSATTAAAERASLAGPGRAARRQRLTDLVATGAAFLLSAAGCGSLANTPAQELALSHWTACHARVTGAELNAVQVDGRIAFWYSGAGEGQAMLECLRQADKTGAGLPEPISELRSGGSGGGGGAM
jgi:DNA-binding PucR family transcriptional regulator